MRRHTDNQKLEAVKCWLITGNLTQTAASLNINLATIKKWKQADWWNELVQDLKSEDNIQLSSKLKKIASKSLMIVEDRLENGDYVFNQKTGKFVKKPISARDTNHILKTSLEATRSMERDEIYKVTQEKQQSQLELLAQRFEEFAKRMKRPVVTDVIYMEKNDAVYDQRETRLLEREELGEDQSQVSA